MKKGANASLGLDSGLDFGPGFGPDVGLDFGPDFCLDFDDQLDLYDKCFCKSCDSLSLRSWTKDTLILFLIDFNVRV